MRVEITTFLLAENEIEAEFLAKRLNEEMRLRRQGMCVRHVWKLSLPKKPSILVRGTLDEIWRRFTR